jgi:hypothetical protein
MLDSGLFDRRSVLLRARLDIWCLDCDGTADIVVGDCLRILVNDSAERAILVDRLTRYGDYAVCGSISDSSAWDMLVNERAWGSEYAKHALFSASVTRSGGSAIATSTTKQMAVIASATEANRSGINAGVRECVEAIVCHVFEGVCLILV